MSNAHDDLEPEDIDSLAADESIAGSVDATHGKSELQDELNMARDRLLRSQAEVENVRRRLQREMQDARRFANQGLLVDLLPVIDNLERAIQSAEKASEDGALLQGVKMVQQQLASAMQKHHCQRVQAEGEDFDPAVHEALAKMPSEDVPEGKVSIVNQHGYQLHDRVIRPAQVVVSSGKPEDA